MNLKLDKSALSTLNSNLKIETDNYSIILDRIIQELDTLNTVWQGPQYNEFIKKYNEDKIQLLLSKEVMIEYKKIIEKSLIDYVSLSEGVHYNE